MGPTFTDGATRWELSDRVDRYVQLLLGVSDKLQ